MTQNHANDPFDQIRRAGTNGANYDLGTDDVIERLTRWQSLCVFTITNAKSDAVDIIFSTLPNDMDAFARDLHEFCPDLVDQGTGCVHELVELMEEAGQELGPEIKELIDGVDLSDADYGLELLKRELQRSRRVSLWWD